MKKWFKKIGKKFYGQYNEDLEKPLKEQSPSVKINKVSAKKPASPKTIENPKVSIAKSAPHKFSDEPRSNWFNKLGDNFKRTSLNFKKVIFSKKITSEELDYLEEALLMADLGVNITDQLISELRKRKFEEGELRNELVKFLESFFIENKKDFIFTKNALPQIILFFGVNGSGKTTTLAKLASKARNQGFSLSIIAADTFRAAAVEQLTEWGARLNLDVFTGDHNEDPSSVVFKGHKQAIENKVDILLIDTAGRLHNKTELMEELKKIVKTIKKNDPDAPHHKLLVLDSTIGQNTYTQLEAFNSYIGITGVIMTKLDSSSKGGSLIGISKKYNTPIHFLGVGEKVDDLIDFNAKDFINALIGNDFGEKDESLH